MILISKKAPKKTSNTAIKNKKTLEEAKVSDIYKKFLESFSDADLISKKNIGNEDD